MGAAVRGQSSGSPDARRTAQTNDRLEHQHENSQRFLGRDGQDGRMRGMRKPRRQETQCCMFEPAGGVDNQDHPTTRTRDIRYRQKYNRTLRQPRPLPQFMHQ